MQRYKIAFADCVRSTEVTFVSNEADLKRLLSSTAAAYNDCVQARERVRKGTMSEADYDDLRKRWKISLLCMLPFYSVEADGVQPDTCELMDDRARYNHLGGIDWEVKDMGGQSAFEIYRRYLKGREAELGVVFVQESLGAGLHVLFSRPRDISMEEAQERFWQRMLGDDAAKYRYDPSFSDLRRRCVMTPDSAIMYADWNGLFAEYTPGARDGAAYQSRTAEGQDRRVVAEDAGREKRMAVFRQSMAKAGVSEADMSVKGGRHQALLRVLSTGVARVLSREELAQCVAEMSPDYATRDRSDMMNLLRDFCQGGKYYDDIACQIAGKYAWLPRHDDYSDPALFQPLAKYWPSGLLQAAKWLGDPAMVLPGLTMWLPGMAACISRKVVAKDPGGWIQPPLMLAALMAPSGGGKSKFRKCSEQFVTVLEEVSKEAFEKRKAYREAYRNRASNEKIKAPHDPILTIGLNSTPSAFAERLELAGGQHFIYCFDDEAGYTMANMEGWGNVAKMINNSWGLERLQVARSSADSVEADVTCTLCCALMMQPMYKPIWEKLLEQGATSRVVWASLPKYIGPVRPIAPMKGDDVMAMQELGRRLYNMEPRDLSNELKPLADRLKQWEEERVAEAIREGDEVMMDSGFRFRICTNAFRAGVILYCCWQSQQEKTGQKKTISLRLLGDQCLYLADYWADQLRSLFGQAIVKKRHAQPVFGSPTVSAAKSKSEDLLGLLPAEFSKKDMKAFRPDASDSALRGIVKRWLDAGRIEEKPGKTYLKVA